MGGLQARLLSSGSCTLAAFPPVVSNRSGEDLCRRSIAVFWGIAVFRERHGIHRIPAATAGNGVGSLRQASVWWRAAGLALSGPVHAPGGHFQSASAEHDRNTGALSMEGLPPQAQAKIANDDRVCR